MSERDFCYWLQGFVEMTDAESINDEQWRAIKDHLKLVMNKTIQYRITRPDELVYSVGPITCGVGYDS